MTEFTEKDWDDVININLRTLFFLSQAVAKVMIKQGKGGKIINTASMLSFQGGIRVPSYTASKSAVMGLTRLMGNELAPYGINVNAIAPGYMATDNTTALRADEQAQCRNPRAHPCRSLGHADGFAGSRCVPRLARVGLRAGLYNRGRWRLAGTLGQQPNQVGE